MNSKGSTRLESAGPRARSAAGHPLDDLKLYLITDRKRFSEDAFLPAIEAALQGGVRALQLREKDLSAAALVPWAERVRALTARYGAALYINGHPGVADRVKADGVHLPETGPRPDEVRARHPGLRIGVSTHSLERARAAETQGADFITFSPIFDTPSKRPYGAPQGLDRLEAVVRAVRIPVLALGGITLNRIQAVRDRGAFGVALISAIWDRPDIQQETLNFLKCLGGDNQHER